MSSSISTVGELSYVTSKYKWVIKNFCTGCKSVGDILTSPKFSTFTDGVETQWQLWLYPKGEHVSSQNYLSIYLYNVSETSITTDASIAILDNKNEVVSEKILGETLFDENRLWGYPRFLSRAYVMNMANNVLVDDKLTIVCEISVNPIKKKAISVIPIGRKDTAKKGEEDRDVDDESETDQTEEKLNSLRLLEFDTFERMITEEDQFSDITLKIDEQTWKAHKCVLAKRSSVFATMFQEEIKDNVLNIENVKPDVFIEFLRYVYSGKVNDIKNIAGELLILAEKYKLDTLFQICEETLSDDLDVSNVIKRLKLAHKCKALNLKKTAVEFAVSNGKDIVVMPDFKELTDVPDVLCEVLYGVVRDTDKK